MIETTSVTTKSGNQINLVATVLGNTGRPEFNKFSEAYEAPEGRKVDARFATTLFLSEKDENGVEKVEKLKVVMWGDVARGAAKRLGYKDAPACAPQATAQLRLLAAVEKPYTHEGERKISYSVSDYRQMEIKKVQPYAPVNTFETAPGADVEEVESEKSPF